MTRKTRTLLGLAAIGLASTYAYASATAGSRSDAPQAQQQVPASVSRARVVIIHVFATGAHPDPAAANPGDVLLWMGVPGDAIEIAFQDDRNPAAASAMPMTGADVVVARVDTNAIRGIYKYTLTVNGQVTDPDVIVW